MSDTRAPWSMARCQVDHCEREASLRLPTITDEVDLCAVHAPWIPVLPRQRDRTGGASRATLTADIPA